MIIATVPYINALPLTTFLKAKVVQIPPAQMLEKLLSGHVDVALMPIYSCLQHQLHMHLDAGLIGCDGSVKSVGFFTKSHITDLAQLKSVYFDQESLSSVYLARIILQEFFNVNLKNIENCHYDNRENADAQLLIGDKALFFDEKNHHYWDLGEIWKKNTELGFIFATWASTRSLTQTEIAELTEAKNQGLNNRSLIIKNFPLDQESLLKEYFAKNIIYVTTSELKAGMELYHRYLKEYGYL